MKASELRRWAADAEAEISSLRDQMAPLEQRIAEARERLDLVARLIALVEHADATDAAPAGEGSVSPIRDRPGSRKASARTSRQSGSS